MSELNLNDGWRLEALQLRQNHSSDSAAVAAFVDMFERNLPQCPLLCLALHHMALRFHKCAGKKTLKQMKLAKLEDLPESIYPKDRIVPVEHSGQRRGGGR